MKIDVLLGLQWGDEGKGKIVDYLTPSYDIISRFQGGPNAGHTLNIGGDKHVLHTIPSGIFHPEKTNVIGNGVIFDPKLLQEEVDNLIAKGVKPSENLLLSKRAHMILPTHRLLDLANEQGLGKDKIGSTLKGIGPCYTDKAARNGVRAGDMATKHFSGMYESLKQKHFFLLKARGFEAAEMQIDGLPFAEYEKLWLDAVKKLNSIRLIDSELYLNFELAKGKAILAEGAQGSLLDLDFGSYPFVTSSNTITAGVCSGLGVAPSKIGKVFGVFKAYCTRVGSGPFPTELNDATGEELRRQGNEFGSTTGRPRRCGWLDLPALAHAIMLNGVTDLIMMKADVMDQMDEVKICTSYRSGNERIEHLSFETFATEVVPEYHLMPGWKTALRQIGNMQELPFAFEQYKSFIENSVGLPISMVSTGPGRLEIIQ